MNLKDIIFHYNVALFILLTAYKSKCLCILLYTELISDNISASINVYFFINVKKGDVVCLPYYILERSVASL